MKNKIAIIGYGYVGKAMRKIFPHALVFDTAIDPKMVSHNELKYPFVDIATKERINEECELAIICVPTPMLRHVEREQGDDGFMKVDTSIVEEVLGWLETPLVLIKSTVPPGFTDQVNDKFFRRDLPRVCFSPEYVGEGKYQITPWKYMSPTDPTTHEFVIIGGEEKPRERIAQIFTKYLGPEKFYYLISATEAEVIKYMENSWGAMKVIFAQEFWELCQKLGISYTRVREGWALDNRVERMHTAVFVDDQGFGGKCYPKDLNGIVTAADEIGVDMTLIKTVLRKNARIKGETK